MIGNIGDLEAVKNRQIGGVPLELGEGRTLFVAHAGDHNRNYVWTEARLILEFREAIEATDPGTVERLQLEADVTAQIICEGVITGWRGFLDQQGDEIEYEPKLGQELLDRLPGLIEQILAVARNREAFAITADTKSD